MAADAQNSQYDSPPFGLTPSPSQSPGSETNPPVPPRGRTQDVQAPSIDLITVGTDPLPTTGMNSPDQYNPGGGGFTEPDGFADTGAAGGSGHTMTQHPNSTARVG